MTRRCLSAENLWDYGNWEGFQCKEEGGPRLMKHRRRGFFISQTYCGGAQIEWDRFTLEMEGNAAFKVYVLLFNDAETGRMIDGMKSIWEMLEYFRDKAQITSNYDDFLLYREGLGAFRYLKFCVDVHTSSGQGEVFFKGYSIRFPKENFTTYLPSLYQNDKDLELFNAVLQAFYLNMEERISELPERMDASVCPTQQLRQLAEWLGYENAADVLDEERLRKLILKGPAFAGRRGTPTYYEELTALLTGKEARLLERKGSNECTLLLYEEPEEWDVIHYIISCAPIGICMKAKVLCKTDHLDDDCYLDYTAEITKKECELRREGIAVDNIILL